MYYERTYEVKKDYDLRRRRSPHYEERLAARLFSPGCPFVIERNAYPYKTQFAHWLVWLNPAYRFESRKLLHRCVRFMFTGPVYSVFENSPEWRSIHGIRHLHVFSEQDAILSPSYCVTLP